MDITLSTPALLFPAVSLLLLAYTNRFLALATLIRQLHMAYERDREARLLEQIHHIRGRLYLIRNMQGSGVLSLLLCTLSMGAFYLGWDMTGAVFFGLSLALMALSLLLSVWEIHISTTTLEILLRDLESGEANKGH
ncbi:MAG: DUF2721 domain-containing protein [Candidatus Methylacidiphilales bacterium]|nr:DUF2721 domain-containing protein [Candidatus Methylacidiphilales bacterium]